KRLLRAAGRGASFGVVSAALVLAVSASPAPAAPTATTPLGPPVAGSGGSVTDAFARSVGAQAIANQDALSIYRGWMREQPGFTDSGYVGSIDDLAHKGTTIMWYGAQTPLLAAIVAEGERRGITVSIQPRRYSLKQLAAAGDAIWEQQAAGQWSGFTISSIGT